MNNAIIITSIFSPSDAVCRFAGRIDSELIVVGDLKTPKDWSCEGARFLSVDAQKSLPFELAKVMPYNHYCRKMLGYLDAIANGAQTIIDTDDDNVPKEDWAFPNFDGYYNIVDAPSGFINIYQLYTEKNIWPRGLPLEHITKRISLTESLGKVSVRIGVWQGLADEDPDVDAVYRLTDDSPTYFNRRDPVVLSAGLVSPFNSQNTQFRRECFPLLYLPTCVTFRFTDILRGLVAQPIMWAAGYRLGFIDATVVQKRNPHNYMRDFESEIPMYLCGEKVIDIVGASVSSSNPITTNLHLAYMALLEQRIVPDQEMVTLDAWIKDNENLCRDFV